MFSRILEQVPGRFGLGQDQGRQLLGLLVAQIFNPKHGGPAGFIQAVPRPRPGRDRSNPGSAPARTSPSPPAQLESVVGSDTLAGFGSRLGIPTATVGNVAAAMLPDAIDELSEHGDLPVAASPLSEKLQHWFGGIGVGLDEFGQWAAVSAAGAGVGAAAAQATTASQATDDHKPGTDKAGASRWLPWVLIVRGDHRRDPAAARMPRRAHRRYRHRDHTCRASRRQRRSRCRHAGIGPFGDDIKFTADDLVAALNLMVVHFDSDSARISAQQRCDPCQGRDRDQGGPGRHADPDRRPHRQQRRPGREPAALTRSRQTQSCSDWSSKASMPPASPASATERIDP